MGIFRRIFNKENTGAWSLGILCFQGFGIRIFDGMFSGAIVLWLVILVLLNLKCIFATGVKHWFCLLGVCALYILFNVIKGIEYAPFVIVAWVSASVVLCRYVSTPEDFIIDIRKLTRFCMYYSLLHIPIMLLGGSLITKTNFPMTPQTFLYLFYFNEQETFYGMHRIQGFCWEPSCWNILLNINWVFVLFFREGRKMFLLSALSIISIMSTTGIVVMSILYVLYFLINMSQTGWAKKIIPFIIVILIAFPFVKSELDSKLDSGSGNARMGDFAIAAAVISEYPLLGADLSNITSNIIAMNAREDAWQSNGDYSGYMEQGMCNSFASMFVEWGLPITIAIFYLFFCSPLFEDKRLRILFITAVICVTMGTPIVRTGFFYLLPLSTILIKRKKQIKNV